MKTEIHATVNQGKLNAYYSGDPKLVVGILAKLITSIAKSRKVEVETIITEIIYLVGIYERTNTHGTRFNDETETAVRYESPNDKTKVVRVGK